MKDIGIKTVTIKGIRAICLYFHQDQGLIIRIKMLNGSYWNSSLRCWVVPDLMENRKGLRRLFSDRTLYNPFILRERRKVGDESERIPIDLPMLDPEGYDLVDRLRRWMVFRRYSESTVRIYTEMLEIYLRFIKPDKPEDMLDDGIQRFTNGYILPRRLSFSYQNQLVNALKLFYVEILKREMEPSKFQRPRPEYQLPNVLNKSEVKRILDSIRNIKHRAMLTTIYGCGLRRAELLHLKPGDIDSKRGLLMVRQGKGRKDRVVPISERNIALLRAYYRQYKPEVWMFEGNVRGRQYDERSLQMVLKQAVRKAGIRKPVTLHWLRHSYATHLHESGVDIRYIQEILGHKDTRTTEIYTHVSSRSIQLIRSPLDDL